MKNLSNLIDPIVLGDNQFFGVNHMSEAKGQATYRKFQDIAEIKLILYSAIDNGVNAVSFSTHPMIYQITELMQKDPVLKKMAIYVYVPYIIKYVQMFNQIGPLGTVKQVLKGNSMFTGIKYALSSAYDVYRNDYLSLMGKLIEVELMPFKNLNVKSIFLHNSLVDLCLGLKMDNVLIFYDEYIKKKFDAIPSYGTHNFSLLCDTFKRINIGSSLIMTPVNKKGFFMNPSRLACEKSIADSNHVVLAMSTLASGSLEPNEAYEYLFSLKNVNNVIVGSSKKEHLKETFDTIRKYIK